MMDKQTLLATLRAARGEYDAALAEVPQERMREPIEPGHWAVKDIVTHLTYFERWMTDRLEEASRGESYAGSPLDFMPFDERNQIIYERFKDLPVDQVLAQSRQTFADLIAAVESHDEAFLIEPQQFEGAPAPMIVWQMLRSEVYEHYTLHIPSIRAFAAAVTG